MGSIITPPPVPLIASDYNANYFDGGNTPHPAGYTSYRRTPIDYADENDPWKKEYFSREAKKVFDQFNLAGKRVLDLGCGKGFHTKTLRDLGADAWGVDWSAYAISHAEAEVSSHLIQTDVTTYVATQPNNSWDFVLGMRLLPCLPVLSLPAFILNIKRIAPKGYFTIDSINTSAIYYNVQIPANWQAQINNPNYIVEEFQSTEHL